MKRLILVRHAKTEALTDAQSDFERKLKKRGHSDADLVARDLLVRALRPEALISSPAVRALQTADIFAGVLQVPVEGRHEARFLYDGDTTAGMLEHLSRLADGADTVMVVGHNPDMASLSMRLTQEHFFHFPTCAAVVISFDIEGWDEMNVGMGRSEYFIYPKALK